MQFTRENAEKVMAGRKTQTRRPVKAGDVDLVKPLPQSRIYFQRDKMYCATPIELVDQLEITGVEHNGRKKWNVGQDYAVQPGRGKHAIGRLRITNIRQKCAGDISKADAIAEGFESVQGFIDIWTRLYGEWAPEQPVWVLDFELSNGSR